MQQIALTVAANNLRGVAAGGMFDDFWIGQLGLKDMGAKLAFGYLAGK